MDKEERGRKMGRIIARAWADDEFKQRLLADATAVLREEGLEVPPTVDVRAVENTDAVFHLVIPSKAARGELSLEELSIVGGGQSCVLDKELKDAWCWLNHKVGGGANV